MKRRSLLWLLASSACHGTRRRELALARALLGVSGGPDGTNAEQASWALKELARLADEAEAELERASRRSPAAVVSQLLFERWGFVREVTDTNLGFVFLPQVLERRRGSCVGLGTLFLALADALGQRASGVLLPGHFYVRVQEQGRPRNVELLRSGAAMPDAWYEQRFPVPGGSAPEYARPLRLAEVLAVVEYNVGNERMRQRRLPEARSAFARAVRGFPQLSEAHASLASVEQLLGNLEAAAASYQRAREANPHLPGVERNLALLAAELGDSSARP
ncbi:MAG TPA: transglutaminase family protein [Polyangiaceae bacterium]|nr:transglutaminase family protein [Polyangiaceae bacterium]